MISRLDWFSTVDSGVLGLDLFEYACVVVGADQFVQLDLEISGAITDSETASQIGVCSLPVTCGQVCVELCDKRGRARYVDDTGKALHSAPEDYEESDDANGKEQHYAAYDPHPGRYSRL